jgi:hypothetical protein
MHYQAIFLAPLPGNEEEEAPTSTRRHQAIFLAPLPGRKRISARGVSRFQSFYFVNVLLYFIFACIFYKKIQKN